MKNNGRPSWIIPVFVIITLFCAACKQQSDNGENLKVEIWNGIKFRQNMGVTDKQYEITVSKFKTAFNSDSFTDEERTKLKNYISNVRIISIGFGCGWFADSDNNKLEPHVSCDSIQDDIKGLLKCVLKAIDEYFTD